MLQETAQRPSGSQSRSAIPEETGVDLTCFAAIFKVVYTCELAKS
jgi:hypothetical protein